MRECALFASSKKPPSSVVCDIVANTYYSIASYYKVSCYHSMATIST